MKNLSVKESNKIKHIPVLLDEVIAQLNPRENQNFVDATLGAGGHTKAILEKIKPEGKVMAFDLDIEAIKIAKRNLSDYKNRIIFINDNYSKLKSKINEFQYNKISGIVCDLGYSSIQVESADRGFSYQNKGFIDLRYNTQTKLTATDILQKYKESDLIAIFKEYGEEVLARKFAKEIIKLRKDEIITGEVLSDLAVRIYHNKWRQKSKIHPATKIWQALRIEVNKEFENLKKFLPQAIDALAPQGRLAIISFHSGEDKIVKDFFKLQAKNCICPPEFPKCVCHHRAKIKIITKKPIVADKKEIDKNPRSRSAKLRVIEKI